MGLINVRVTSATKRRSAQLVLIIREMQRKTVMTAVDMQILLDFSASGIRKYTRDLQEAGLIYPVDLKHAEYQITPDKELIDEWINKLEGKATEPSGGYSNRKYNLTKAAQDQHKRASMFGDRQIHTMGDDVSYLPRLAKITKATRDPLVAALFGNGPALT